MEEIRTIIRLMEQMHIFAIGKALLIFALGYLLARLARNGINRLTLANLTPHGLVMFRRVVFYGILILTCISVMKEL